jgi:hypothetical protein
VEIGKNGSETGIASWCNPEKEENSTRVMFLFGIFFRKMSGYTEFDSYIL